MEKGPQNIIQNENATKRTTNIKNKFKNIDYLIVKPLKIYFGKNYTNMFELGGLPRRKWL
jgi:hypothetical protein